jgi:RNA polymerase sigma factor (sigma-70 family)
MKAASAEQLIQTIRQFHDREQFRLASDSALLAQFVDSRNESAFEELLFRLGPMVWGICVRGLGPAPEADDAFQAVFLILVRRASELRRPELVAGWVCRTAQQVVRKAARQRSRRRSREVLAEHLLERSGESSPPQDWRPLFDRAVNQLPEKYREVLILCELRQFSRSEAAQLLGLNENTLSSRLARAKELLRNRLAHTGVALPAGMAMTLAVPTALCSATLNLALALLSSPGASAKVLPATLLPLMQGGWSAMFISKCVIGLAAMVLIGFSALESGAGPTDESKAQSAQEKRQAEPEAKKTVPSEAANAHGTPPLTGARNDRQRLQGKWEVRDWHRPSRAREMSSKMYNPLIQMDEFEWVIVGQEKIDILDNTRRAADFTFQLDESPNPGRIDLFYTYVGAGFETMPQVRTYYGVYEFATDGTLVMRFGENRDKRPTLEAKAKYDAVLTLTLQREKQADTAKGAAPESPTTDPTLPPAKEMTDLQKLQGGWLVKKLQPPADQGLPDADQVLFDESRTPTEVYFRDGGITFLHGNAGIVGKLYLRETFVPRRIDLVFDERFSRANPQIPVVYFGVYEFSKDGTLQLSLSSGDRTSRPTSLDATVRDKLMTLTLERKPRPDSTQGAIPPEIRELLGQWIVKDVAGDGPPVVYQSSVLDFETDRVFAFDQSSSSVYRLTIDAHKKPRWIDLKSNDQEWRGNYAVSGDELKIALNQGPERASENNENQTLITATRKKGASSSAPPEPVAKAPSPEPEKPASEYVEHSGREIILPLSLSDPKQRKQIREIRLLVSRDQGGTWEWNPKDTVTSVPDDLQGMAFNAPAEGRYDFALQTIATTGEAFPKTQDLKPLVKVRVVDPKRLPAKFPAMTAILPGSESNPPVVPTELQQLKKENEELRQKLLELQRRMEAWEQKQKLPEEKK